MRRPVRLPVASAAGAAVHEVSDDAHAGNAILMDAAVEHALAAGHGTTAAVAGLMGQPDVLAEQQLELGLSEVQEVATSGAALNEVGSAWTHVRDRHNHNMRRAGGTTVAADTAPSGSLAYASGTATAAAL